MFTCCNLEGRGYHTDSAVMRLRVVAMAFFLLSAASDSYGAAPSSRTNIVFMMADDLGYGDVHYNGGREHTPNLDAMAASPHSIQLQRYYSGGPVCSPTRGTVLTGRNHNRYCVWTANAGNNQNDFEKPSSMPLPTSEITLADILKEHGYQSALFGKWHLGDFKKLHGPGSNPKWPVSHPGMHGFDEWWATERSAPTTNLNCACFNTSLCPLGHYTDHPPCTNYYTYSNGSLTGISYPFSGDDSQFIVENFEKFVHQSTSAGNPFFAYLPFHTVHIRYIAAMGNIMPYSSQGFDKNHTDYYGAITGMDSGIGRVRDILRMYNVSNNTLLWFTSDNGPEHRTPGETAGFRGRKRDLYEGGIRVPGIIEWPDVVKENIKSSYPIVSSDLLPTVCDILGVSPPKDRPIDGASILPFLRGERDKRNETIKWAYDIKGKFNGTYNAAISGDQYKVFAEYESGSIKDAFMFDLEKDPFEKTDVSLQHPELFEDMKTELEQWRQSVIHSATEEVKCYGYSLHYPENEE